ncbi:MAG: TonB-dependent receptor, partial [Bacteroidota bacterium]
REGISIGGNYNYNYSDNNYTMEAFVFEDNERRDIERFHDAYRLNFASAYLDIRGKRWADRFRVTLSGNEFIKEVQNGGIIGNLAFGSVKYDGEGASTAILYEKQLGEKFNLTTNAALSATNVLFIDTTANTFSWSGAVLRRDINRRGELGGSSISDRDFYNVANRVTLTWSLSPRDEIKLSNLVARQSTIGRDTEEPIEEDPLTIEQVLFQDVLGLQYERKIGTKLTVSGAGKLYVYDIEGADANTLAPVGTEGTAYGYYGTAKYDVTDRFFLRASYENALRIPTFAQFFGNGANIAANLTLEPETSDNFNLGFSYASARKRDIRFLLTANGFIRAQKNLIFLSAATFPRNINADDVDSRGVEGSLNVWFRDAFQLNLNATRLRQVYGEIRSLSQTQSLEGTDFPNVPKWFYNARLTYNSERIIGDVGNFLVSKLGRLFGKDWHVSQSGPAVSLYGQ